MFAVRILSGRRRVCRLPSARWASAFTLLELIVVISLVALLVAILVPSMGQVFDIAYATICRNQLRELGKSMHGGSVETALSIPAGSAWTGAAASFGSKDLLICPKDDGSRLASTDSLADYYILQCQSGGSDWRVSSIPAILGIGPGVMQDPQVHYKDIPAEPVAHHGHHPCWCYVPIRAENQDLISITDEATILLTFDGAEIIMESIVGCGCSHCCSDHWLMKGDCIDGPRCMEEDEVVMQLGGNNYRVVSPNSPHVIQTETASYGINSLIEQKRFGGQQLMLMDAKRVVIPVGESDWMDEIDARHRGKVNYVTVSGGVRSTTKAELYDEYLLYQSEGADGRSLWSYRACPRGKP